MRTALNNHISLVDQSLHAVPRRCKAAPLGVVIAAMTVLLRNADELPLGKEDLDSRSWIGDGEEQADEDTIRSRALLGDISLRHGCLALLRGWIWLVVVVAVIRWRLWSTFWWSADAWLRAAHF